MKRKRLLPAEAAPVTAVQTRLELVEVAGWMLMAEATVAEATVAETQQ